VKPVRIEPEVYDDLAEAADWYDMRERGVGDRFLAAMRKLMETIGERPHSFAPEGRHVRVAFAKPFPYKIYYLDTPESVRIFAVLHAARDPDVWRARVPRHEP
jgi:toxin ParE1/3/4